MWIDITFTKYLDVFIEKCRVYWGSKFPKAYLEQGRVYGIIKNDLLVAGIALVDEGHLRTLTFLNDDLRKGTILEYLADYNFCEISGFFIDPQLSSSKDSIKIYKEAVNVLKKSSKKYFIWGFNANQTGLVNLYQKLGAKTIYTGEPYLGNPVPGSPQVKLSFVAVTKSSLIFKIYWYNLVRLLSPQTPRGISRKLENKQVS